MAKSVTSHSILERDFNDGIVQFIAVQQRIQKATMSSSLYIFITIVDETQVHVLRGCVA
jgi:hypothetical protein